jgi:uncharacterized alpha/beta hydrolase family protein
MILTAILTAAFFISCGGPTLPEKLEISLTPVKGYEGGAKGTAVIDTKTGTDITINISGLKPDEVYTAFFVNVKSQMFQGVGPEPHVLAVNPDGTVNFQGTIEKDSYIRFVRLAIYLNPEGKPIQNPLGVKATLGALMKPTLPKMILEGKLR